MDNEEFVDWVALESIDPMPDAWVMNALNCQTIANVNRSRKKPYELADWLPIKQKKPLNESQVKSMFMNLKRAMGKST